MLFYLSKFSYFLINPVNWVLACLIIYLFVKSPKIKRWAKWTSIVVAILFSNPFLHRSCLMAWQPEVGYVNHIKSYPAGILLTGMTMSNQKREQFFGGTSDRFIQTARLYHTGIIRKIIISGGDASISQTRPKEALFLQQELIAQNIPAADIMVESESRNTYESAIATQKLLKSLSIQDSVVLITSAMHMRRAAGLFAKAGIPCKQHPANFEVLENKPGISDILIPRLDVLTGWHYLTKEMVGLLVYRITGKA